jgi:DNA-binding transcriptional LysR family regulator
VNLLASMRYLVALNEHRHFGRAAQACHITQPALSNALRALEQEFGVVIVQRGRTYAGLTHEGERVLSTAQRMLHEHEVLQQELNSGADRPQGVLRIGAVPTAMPMVARFSALLQARYPGITPAVRSMSSPDIETELDAMSLDIGLGYTDRLGARGLHLEAHPQYTEHYYFVRRAAGADADGNGGGPQLRIGTPMPWIDAAQHPLCLLTPEMHNRTIVDSAFAMAGAEVRPAIETNSILTLAISVVVGEVCSVLPGALLDAVRGYGTLEALPLVQPDVQTPIGFMTLADVRPSRVLDAALSLAREEGWLKHAAAHSGDFD